MLEISAIPKRPEMNREEDSKIMIKKEGLEKLSAGAFPSAIIKKQKSKIVIRENEAILLNQNSAV